MQAIGIRTAGALLATSLLATGAATAQTAGMSAADRFAEREAVELVLDRYVRALDLLEPEAYADVFAPEGEIVIYGEDVHRGRAELIDYLQGVKENQEAAEARGELQQFFHVHYNARITIADADTAYHYAYWTTTARMPDESIEDLAVGTLKDEFVKRDGQWFLLRRELFHDPQPVEP